jgi:hypothetical protein
MEVEELAQIKHARNNLERIARQASSDAGIMELIITLLPPELGQRAIKFAEDLRYVSDEAAELVIELDKVLEGDVVVPPKQEIEMPTRATPPGQSLESAARNSPPR